MYNEGQRAVIMTTREGATRHVKLTFRDARRAIGSACQMCRTIRRVPITPPCDPECSYINHICSGEEMWLDESNGLYVFNAKTAPTSKQSCTMNNMRFVWQVGCDHTRSEGKTHISGRDNYHAMFSTIA